nr:hypothetical protein [Mesorhizobium sp. L48C026A00]
MATRLLSSGVISCPAITRHSRAEKYSGVTPRTTPCQLLEPIVNCSRAWRSGAATTTPGISIPIAVASSSLSRGAPPAPSRTLPIFALPGLMLMRLAPRLRI